MCLPRTGLCFEGLKGRGEGNQEYSVRAAKLDRA